MSQRDPNAITLALRDAQAGAPEARDRLVALVYGELRQMAGQLMQNERAEHTLQPTALVNEALLRMLEQDALSQAENRRWLFAAAARAMRQVLVDHARTRGAAKRGSGGTRVPLDEKLAGLEAQNLDVLALHEQLEVLAGLHERQARIIEMRFFGGFKIEEIAQALDVSVSLVESDLRKASAFLRSRLQRDD